MKLRNLMLTRAMKPQLMQTNAVARFVSVHDAIDSTHDEAVRLLADERTVASLAYGDGCAAGTGTAGTGAAAETGAAAGTGYGVGVVAADMELEAKFRFNRTWVSIPGESIAMSLVTLVPHGIADDEMLRGWLSPIGCLAAIDAIRGELRGTFPLGAALSAGTASEPQLTLRWPNDIYCNGLKLGSVNVDAVDVPSVPGHVALVYTFGVNLTVRADFLPTPEATSLRMHVLQLPAFERMRDEIVARIATSLADRLASFAAQPEAARAGFYEEARRLCPMYGRFVAFQLGDGSRVGGEILGLNDDASLTMSVDGSAMRLRTRDVGIMA